MIATTTYVVVQSSGSQITLEELTVPVVKDNLKVKISASGKVEPIKSVNVSPKNPGRLIELRVEQGDKVVAGQTLAVMENLEIQARNAQSQAQLQQARANLQQNKVTIAGDIRQSQARLAQNEARLAQAKARIPREISQTQAQLQSAESRLKLTQERMKRNRYLVEKGAISQDSYDEAFNENQNALAGISEVKQQLEQLENTQHPEIDQLEAIVAEMRLALEQREKSYQDEINALQAQVDLAQANLEQSQIQYDDTIVKAPFEGIITQRYAVEGAFVTPSTSASTSASASATSILALAQGLEIIAKVPEVDIGQLYQGQKVEIIADAYPEDTFTGRVKRIAPEAIVEDNVTSFEVRISLLTGQEKLRSKMNVDITFLGKELNNTLVVPTVAIVTQAGETGVMILNEENKPEFIPVKIGLTLQDKTQIIDGVTADERVFIDMPDNRQR
ncbi:RND family efflux transporter, MFP subunit [Xenococcus sp. PCC 7305]|nr:efflux RND transporter periplasmic adaptor subunit [Xenococcus sp. PCC 7305]ELS02398.1 RND family efflux transporter, MFP subunit [Xenococcus sp. PCC 7305]